ncbi:MAG: complex I subunit 5 family protein [Bacillota bacterium]
MTDIFTIEINEMSVKSMLPLLIVLFPIIGSLLIGFVGLNFTRLRDVLAVSIAGLTFYLTLELFLTALEGYTVYFDLPPLAGIAMSFKVDLFGSVFALFSAFIWFLATLVSLPYMLHEERQTRYYVFLILSLGGCLGVFLTEDFLSLLIFFELMTLAAYALVVHNQTREAISAGGNYLYLGVIGGLSLLSGIILLSSYTGTVTISPMLQDITELKGVAALIALLMIVGFGVKAGMVPLHIWLPQAHPVAPTPASALLSGVMIKAGAYGIIRVVNMLYTPSRSLAETNLWVYTENLGHVIIWIGIITMISAALMAVLQNNAKRLLAYSSISQMGYILMGIGAAGYLGYDGPMGFGGFSYHILNHAFFKSGMFILFGIIYARLHEKRLDHLGGLWNKFPCTFIAFAVCAAGITGIPGFNGYVSKTLLHHAIEYAYEHHHLWDLWLAEKLYVFTSGLTVCYIAKLFISLFLGPRSPSIDKKLESTAGGETWIEKVVALSFIGTIIYLGLSSSFILKNLITPMGATFTYSDYYLSYLADTSVWHLQDLTGVAIAFLLGAGIFVFLKIKDLFAYSPPPYLSVERSIYKPSTKFLKMSFTRVGRSVDDILNMGFHATPVLLKKTSLNADYLDDRYFRSIGIAIVCFTADSWDKIYYLWTNNLNRYLINLKKNWRRLFMLLFKFDYSARGDRRFQVISVSNIDFDLYVILIIIGVILAASLLVFI